jgi:hypothetical protein
MPNFSRPVANLLCAVATASLPNAARADYPVVESHGPSARHFPEGSSLPDDAVILLRAGDGLVIQRSVGPVTYRGPGYFRLKDEPTFIPPPRRWAPRAGAGPHPPPRGRWVTPGFRHDGSERMAERGLRDGFIVCPGNPRCPG